MKSLRYAAIGATVLAFIVVMLGAYTRLTDAGLGCPDWPGCYGHMVLPSKYPLIAVESLKAWTEMIHRYAAGTLVILTLFISTSVWILKRKGKPLPWAILPILLLLIGFQAALGMWTVTLKLLPVVVMGHLLGGILILTCLSYFGLQLWIKPLQKHEYIQWRPWINLGILIVFIQIALGGWVSSNYAGMACVGFPRCNGAWIPSLNFTQGFNLFSSIGANYQGGILDNDARVTIQFVHRLGALITATYIILLSIILVTRTQSAALKRAAYCALILVIVQFGLGIINVIYLLPLWSAVAHNAVAALLLITVVSMRYFTIEGASHASKS